MAQPIAGDQYTTIGTIGTVVVSNEAATIRQVIVPGTYVGTVKFHDAPSATGTTATSAILTFGLPGAYIPSSLEIDAQFKKGIVYESTGTPNIVLTWGK